MELELEFEIEFELVLGQKKSRREKEERGSLGEAVNGLWNGLRECPWQGSETGTRLFLVSPR